MAVEEVNDESLFRIASRIIPASGIDETYAYAYACARAGKSCRQRGRRVFDTKISGRTHLPGFDERYAPVSVRTRRGDSTKGTSDRHFLNDTESTFRLRCRVRNES